MSEPVVSLIPVRAADLAVGAPLPRSIYDWHGKLLLAQGFVLENQKQLDDLLDSGFIQDTAWEFNSVPTARPPVQQPAAAEPAVQAQGPARGDENQAKEIVVGMDDVRWYVGETLYLQQIDNSSIRYTVRLIGFVKNKTVFVTAPSTDGKLDFIRDGQTFIVRAFSGKKAYAFVAAAVKSVHSPHPYLHLSYPKEVRCTVVRKGVRAEVKIIAAVSLGSAERTGAATLTDLSMGGTSGTVKQILGTKGEEGHIKFKVRAAGQDEFLNLRMVLRSVAPSENGDGFKHGFEFVDVSIHDRLILSAFVHQTLAERD
ncbi:flagellar brake protein [Noviherbaspirillum sp. CPCC 100848]|uniref:Flagellar brake protein n=1 Tax=Noviherbaspirillum album TaxID=3080276 RepID=A0ABU6JCR6_9BURK|nr:flagellar brake protein [Noviherbaspirillum sp. CPCC 100848]MEC4721441.1 flagellar brake protein [Noviherbaspirillum sp. CPCC 100848]